MEFLLFALLGLAVPFVLPIASWVSARRTRRRVEDLEAAVAEQTTTIERLSKSLAELRRQSRPEPAPGQAAARAADVAITPPAPVAPVPVPVAAPKPVAPPPAPVVPVAPPPRVAPPAPAARPVVENPWPGDPPRKPVQPAPPVPPAVERPWSEPARPQATDPPRPHVPPVPPRPPVRAEGPPEPPKPPFDWESLVGVKLFSAIAGIALVLAAIFFLRYSVQQGWLQPPVRVMIGIAVAIALLVVCELKAARKYPATANALDAAAIAILFATFFAAHALWNLIPAGITFGLLAVVTALAVLLSIRRESPFIAVLGLLGGFATPALLSTGENRPIPLFAYLLLLNVGLAWVAHRQTWPVLSILTLALTTIYQWGWTFKFLAESSLPLAMGVFLIFPIVSVTALLLARRSADAGGGGASATFERSAMVAAALPILFAAYLAAVPGYGARPALLFGFLALIDVGLLALDIARRQTLMHATGAVATVLVTAVWLATSYRPDFRVTVLAFTSGFVALYLIAPVVAGWFARPLSGPAAAAAYAAPFLLFVFPVIARIDPASADPRTLFAPLFGLVVLCAWRAIATTEAFLYFVAAFFAVAAQAAWSTQHLTVERLGAAIALYGAFGALTAGVPLLARRLGRALQPEAAAGLMLLASMGLLLFLASGDIAPAALWALALLLAILNAGVFLESASARMPAVAIAGTLLSWVILGIWWSQAAASVGILASLAIVGGLTLVTLAGYAWAQRTTPEADIGGSGARDPGARRAGSRESFERGLYLALAGHMFLFFVALNREWSLPPWPLFGALAVLTLAVSATSLATRAGVAHVAGVVAASVIVLVWTSVAAVAPWPTAGLAASAAISLFALVWLTVAARFQAVPSATAGAIAALFLSELTAVVSGASPGRPPFYLLLAVHVANGSILLALSWRQRWHQVAVGAAIVSGAAAYATGINPAPAWQQRLALAAALYAVYTAYPLIVGARDRAAREPWFVALIAAVATFFAAREAFVAADLEWMIGIVPVAQGLVTAVLLRALLRLEPPGARDAGRLALVAAAALGFVTVAIPLQLDHQWITLGWALEGAALAWLYGRVPHRGLLMACAALLGAVFVRLAVNPAVFSYEPRGATRIFNWYLYTYLIAAAALFAAAWWLSRTDDDLVDGLPRLSRLLPAGAVILLFLLLNIEIADYYSTGPEITFRFGGTVSQDLTYTIGWLAFGMVLLAAGIYARARPARITAVSLIAVTTFKCFLYDLGSLGGLYRVASFVGLAMSLALVSVALQKYVMDRPRGTA